MDSDISPETYLAIAWRDFIRFSVDHILIWNCFVWILSECHLIRYQSNDVTHFTRQRLKDSHTRAWATVKEFIEQNLMIFPGKLDHAESAVMPKTKSWIRTSLDEMSCMSADDHGIYLWLNAPSVGIIPSEKYDYFLTCIACFLSDWPKNSVCIIIHPNRAAQMDKRTCCMSIRFFQRKTNDYLQMWASSLQDVRCYIFWNVLIFLKTI